MGRSFGGGAGVLTCTVAFPVIAGFSAVVMWAGDTLRLSGPVVRSATDEMPAAIQQQPALACPGS